MGVQAPEGELRNDKRSSKINKTNNRLLGPIEAAVRHVVPAQMGFNQIIGLTIAMITLDAVAISASGVTQIEADVRPLLVLCGTSVVLILLALWNAHAGRR